MDGRWGIGFCDTSQGRQWGQRDPPASRGPWACAGREAAGAFSDDMHINRAVSHPVPGLPSQSSDCPREAEQVLSSHQGDSELGQAPALTSPPEGRSLSSCSLSLRS